MTLGWSKDQCHHVELAGRLHDIGKLGLPDRLMLKPDTLREAERQYVAAHAKVGAELLAQAVGAAFELAKDVARFHHERWDGEGYPYGLAAERIPIAARIISLVDTFDVLTHDQPYCARVSSKEALAEISRGLASQFDPKAGALFIAFAERLCEAHLDLDKYLGHSAQSTAFTEARRKIEVLLRDAPVPELQ